MSVSPRGNGSWQVSLYMDGKRRRKDVATLAEAEALEARWVEERDGKVAIPRGAIPAALRGKVITEDRLPEDITLKDLVTATYEARWKGKRAGEAQRDVARQALQFFGEDFMVRDISADWIAQYGTWIAGQNGSPATINRRFSALSVCLKHAEDKKVIPMVPKIKRTMENGSRKMVLSYEMEETCLKVLEHWGKDEQRDIFILLVETGLRVDVELLKLEQRDVLTVPSKRLHVRDGKFGKERFVPLTDRAYEAAMRACGRAREKGRAKLFGRTYESVRYDWERLRVAVGMTEEVDFVPHMLRHTCCTRLAENGMDLLKLKDWMGHTSITTTMRYAHVAAKHLQVGADLLNGARAAVTAKPELKVV